MQLKKLQNKSKTITVIYKCQEIISINKENNPRMPDLISML